MLELFPRWFLKGQTLIVSLRHKLEDMEGVSNAAAQTQAGVAAELELAKGIQAL